MIKIELKQLVYDLASLWAEYDVEIYASVIDGPNGNPTPASLVTMSMFQWIRFYLESDERYPIRPSQQSWFRMSCRKGGSKYQLFTEKLRKEPLRVSEILNDYDRQEILFRRFDPVTDWRPVEPKIKRTLYPNINHWAESRKLCEQYTNRNEILFRQFGDFSKRCPLAGGVIKGYYRVKEYYEPEATEENRITLEEVDKLFNKSLGR